MPETKLIATLRSLHAGKVEFVLVGGLAAVLHGAPIQTYDVDLVYSLEAAGVDRLLVVLESMDAIFRLCYGGRLARAGRKRAAESTAGVHTHAFGGPIRSSWYGFNGSFYRLPKTADRRGAGATPSRRSFNHGFINFYISFIICFLTRPFQLA
jgi:hypothetical protein